LFHAATCAWVIASDYADEGAHLKSVATVALVETVTTTISCKLDRAGSGSGLRVRAAFLVIFIVSTAWIPVRRGGASLFYHNGSVTALKRGLLHFGLSLDEASVDSRGHLCSAMAGRYVR